MTRVWAILALLVAGAVWTGKAGAETEVDAYGLGHHKPEPESWLKLDEDLSIRVRVLHRNGSLADVVPAPEMLQAEVTFFGRKGAPDRDVHLFCSARFIDAQAVWSDYVIKDKPCYSGRLSDATGQFVALDMDLRFRPVTSDPAGTSAVLVQVWDKVVDDHISLSPTYGWQGGRK